jgi:hypothetical protein
MPSRNESYNYLRLAQEVAKKGIYVFSHHLNAYPKADLIIKKEMEAFSEISRITKVVLGMDNPTTTKECGVYRFGTPQQLIDYAFGGIEGTPEINTSYIIFYEQDIDAAEDGIIGKYHCEQWIEDFGEAFEKAYQRWELYDEDPPYVKIIKPKKGVVYVFDREITPSLLGNTIIFGEITLKCTAYDNIGVESVAFYIDDVLKHVDYNPPFEWLLDEFIVGKHELKVVAYDKNENAATDKMMVIIFNL